MREQKSAYQIVCRPFAQPQTHTQTERQTHRQRDRHTDTGTHARTHAQTHTHRHTDRHTDTLTAMAEEVARVEHRNIVSATGCWIWWVYGPSPSP